MDDKSKNIIKIIFSTLKYIIIFIVGVVAIAWKTLCELAKKY